MLKHGVVWFVGAVAISFGSAAHAARKIVQPIYGMAYQSSSSAAPDFDLHFLNINNPSTVTQTITVSVKANGRGFVSAVGASTGLASAFTCSGEATRPAGWTHPPGIFTLSCVTTPITLLAGESRKLAFASGYSGETVFSGAIDGKGGAWLEISVAENAGFLNGNITTPISASSTSTLPLAGGRPF